MFGKKIFLTLGTIALVVASAAMFAAFEAHVINVTAKIENALSVTPDEIMFGTVFPEEVLYKNLDIRMSDSFAEESNADDIAYVIKQKPKCVNSDGTKYGRVTEDAYGKFVCVDDGYTILPSLCPFLSKTPDADPDPSNDTGIEAFHGSLAWTSTDTENTKVVGYLNKTVGDTEDNWTIDLHVPCFKGNCAQDEVIPDDYKLDPKLEHEVFGCDLWVEVTGISRTQTLRLENKDNNWNEIDDNTYGDLVFNTSGPVFSYNFNGQGLTANENYSLIYYADPWKGNHPGALIASGTADGSGNLSLVGNVDLNMDLPDSADANYLSGAKIWLVLSGDYNSSTNEMTNWNPSEYLFEHELITYDDTDI